MKFQIEGEDAAKFMQNVGSFFVSLQGFIENLSKRANLEAHILDMKTPQTKEEITVENELQDREMSLRKRRIEVEELELKAREEKAKADLAESSLRMKMTDQRRNTLTRPFSNNNKNKHPNQAGKSNNPAAPALSNPQGNTSKEGGEEVKDSKGVAKGTDSAIEGLKFKPFDKLGIPEAKKAELSTAAPTQA